MTYFQKVISERNSETNINCNATKYRLRVYDRIGRTVYKTEEYNKPWNGKRRKSNVDCKEGVYFYRIEFILNEFTNQDSIKVKSGLFLFLEKINHEKKIIECVPNFSNGRDKSVIDNITNQIKLVEGVKLLSVEPGEATNRTVVTFVGEPEKVIKAAFLAIKKASELIDMSKQTGEHPRMGATDVCPLIPISGISMEETVSYAKKLGKHVGEELKIPVYLYEDAATKPERKNLANIRSGEYEALEEKLKQKEWKPDFGSTSFDIAKKTGATAIGARDFLIAYNINLNTTSTRRANAVAFDIREKGRISREGGKLTGKILKDKKGNTIWKPGSLKHVKAIGWFIEEYGIAQISMNLTNIKQTPIHIVFDEVCKKAQERGSKSNRI